MRNLRVLSVLLLSIQTFHLQAEILSLSSEEAEYCFVSPEAEYEWVEGTLLPRKGLFSYFSGSNSPIYPELVYPGEVDRGNALSGFIFLKEDIEQILAILSDSEGNRLVKTKAFRIGTMEGFQVWSFLLGIPSTFKRGEYALSIEGSRIERNFTHLGEIRLIQKEFPSAQIALNLSLTALLTKKDIQKEKEAKELRELIYSFNPDSVFHTGNFILPVTGARRSADFADRREYQFTDGGSSFSLHNGIDLAAQEGTNVFACGSGKIVFAAYRIMSGNTVVIEHLPGLFSLYYHLKDLKVKVGDMVGIGQVLGTIGMTGLATGPHLHWELRISGVAVDPEAFIQRPLIDKTTVSSIIKSFSQNERR